ncbi:MAG: class II aldolase/adducin family protein [Anaerolineae bacterium]|nr:class II aldolase/adducin family protein [Anaerolineae bacterium]
MAIDPRLYEEMRYIGRDIFVTGLTSSHGGNMSVRVGSKIIIKRRGAQFGQLKPTDFVETSFRGRDSGIMRASSELIVHRAIYEQTSALAVIHCHPRTAVVLSLSRDAIIPIDVEGSYVLHKVPVLATEHASGSPEMAELISKTLREYKIVMHRGHGCFSIGQTLEEAYQWITALEEASDIIWRAALLGEERKEFRKHGDAYDSW